MENFDIKDDEIVALAELERVRHAHAERYQRLLESVGQLDDDDLIDLLLAGLEMNEKEGN